MAGLFKPKITRYLDVNGRRVAKSTAGAKQVREESKIWWGEYRDANGVTRRVSLFRDKSASQVKLASIVKNVERQQAGIVSPFEEHLSRSLAEHLADYEAYLRSKNGTELHRNQVLYRIRQIAEGCQFTRLTDIDAPKVATWLADRRHTSKRFSAQTSNFYLDAFKYFCNWLVTHGRLPKNPVAMLRRVNVATDRRHDRRSLSDEEFRRLVEAAENGAVIEAMEGPDRAMMYIVAAWTGFRRREISSITRLSLELEGDTPAIRVAAGYSKRRKQDAIPLHPYVVERLKSWLDTKTCVDPKESLFPLEQRKGFFKKTSKMMQLDLKSARQKWISEATTDEERARRSASGFLAYQDHSGLFADFHSNRHTFISNLARAGVPLAVAQKLARHSDPRLTANRYTHLELETQAAAIASLPSPNARRGSQPSVHHKVATDEGDQTLVAVGVAVNSGPKGPVVTTTDKEGVPKPSDHESRKSLNDKTLGASCHQESNNDRVHPSGLEPLTFGSVDRCSIQLS